ncbi:hypothetical protein KY308_02670 [Candidatus Woesearchaeota archaeon]|nr:hypothetical protein [Candidatus Woesearchaeota archaeon]
MPEQKIVVSGMTVQYEGIMNLRDIYKIIDDWQKDNDYDTIEKLNAEYVRPEGKYIELTLEPEKKVSDYVKNIIKIKLIARNIKDVTVEDEGRKKKMQEGELAVTLTGVLETDYEGKWEQKATIFFLRVLVDKYIYKFYTDKFESALAKEIKDLHTQIKSFLNLYKF